MKCLTLALFFWPPCVALSQGRLTLDQAMELAAENAHMVKAQGHEIDKARWQYRSALSNIGPKLVTTFDWQRFNKEVVVSLDLPKEVQQVVGGPSEMVVQPLTNWRASVSVVQPLTGLASVALASHLARLSIDQARMREAMERHNARLKCIDAYIGVLRAQGSVRALEAAERSAAAHLERMRRFLEQGLARQDDVLRVEVRLEQLRQGLAMARVGLDVAGSQLALLLDRPLGTQFEVEDVRDMEPLKEPLDSLIEEALDRRVEVQQARKAVEMARYGAALKAMEFLPSLNAIFSWNRTKETSFVEPESYFIGLSLSFTAFEWGRRFFDQAAAYKDHAAAKEALAQVEDLVRLDVRSSYLAAQAAFENIARAELALKEALENQRIQSERAQQRLATTTDLLDAETLVVQATADRDAAVYGYAAARRKLMIAVGR